MSFWDDITNGNWTGVASDIGKLITSDGGRNAAGIAGALIGLTGGGGGSSAPVGYQGGIPKYTAKRQQVPQAYDATRRPGSGGRRYFTDTQFEKNGLMPGYPTAEELAAQNANSPFNQLVKALVTKSANTPAATSGADVSSVKTQQPTQSDTIHATPPPMPVSTTSSPAPPANPAMQKYGEDNQVMLNTSDAPTQEASQGWLQDYINGAKTNTFDANDNQMINTGEASTILGAANKYGYSPAQIASMLGNNITESQVVNRVKTDYPTLGSSYLSKYGFAEGGIARYLQGGTDGMADEVPSSIGGAEPAALSHGEFVIPADVVSHLGNGNSDAGADVLYNMMDRIRKARTGTTEQGKRIDPAKFTPGGKGRTFDGKTGTEVPAFADGGTVPPDPLVGKVAGSESSLSSWAGPYVTDMLGKGAALAEQPYQSYQGPLTAGSNELQDKAASGIGSVNFSSGVGSYDPTSFTTDGVAGKFMNPYLQQSLDPQLAEARRQADITRVNNASRMTKAGSYGGSRQAIEEAELDRNLGTNLATITGTGYNNAFNAAQGQFNTEEDRKRGAVTDNNQNAFKGIQLQSDIGGIQRGIDSEGIAADKKQFEEERDDPYKKLQFQQSLLQGTPLSTTSTTYNTPSTLSNVLSSAGGIQNLYDILFGK